MIDGGSVAMVESLKDENQQDLL